MTTLQKKDWNKSRKAIKSLIMDSVQYMLFEKYPLSAKQKQKVSRNIRSGLKKLNLEGKAIFNNAAEKQGECTIDTYVKNPYTDTFHNFNSIVSATGESISKKKKVASV